MTLHRVNQTIFLLARPKTGTIKIARIRRRKKRQYSPEKNESGTLKIYRKSRSGVRWAVVLAYASSSRREKSRDQFRSIPDLTLLKVEFLINYGVSQKLASPQDLHSNDPKRDDLLTWARTISW